VVYVVIVLDVKVQVYVKSTVSVIPSILLNKVHDVNYLTFVFIRTGSIF